MNTDALSRLLNPIKSRIYNVIGRAVVTAMNNNNKTLKCQIVLFQQDVYDGIDVLQNYGFESLIDSTDAENECLVSSIGGNRNLSAATAIHNRTHRPKTLTAGEVMVYSKFGQTIHLKADGSIALIPAAGKSVDLYGTGGSPVTLETIIAKLNGHKHSTIVPTHGTIQSNDMKTDGVELIAGTDSAANVKAKA